MKISKEQRDENTATMLWKAHEGEMGVVENYLNMPFGSVNINATSEHYLYGTLLHILADKSDDGEDMISLVFARYGKVVDVNARNTEGNTPLHEVLKDGLSEAWEDLIRHGADLNLQNNEKKTPPHLAVIKKNLYALTLMLSGEFHVNVLIQDDQGRDILDLAREKKAKPFIDLIQPVHKKQLRLWRAASSARNAVYLSGR